MADPKGQQWWEAPTRVDRSSNSPAAKQAADAVQTPPSDLDPATLADSPTLAGEAPTLADASNLPPRSPAAPTVPAGLGRTPTGPISGTLLQPGTVLGNRYEIVQVLGEGGMGAVYKAKDRELDRFVALKVIRPELAGNPSILQRFKQEIILARQITHRNVTRIFDLGEADGIRFITMEYVEGENLHQILRRQGKLPVDEAVDIMEQVLGGLQAAHREGVIHRDLKPGNIMRDAQGRVVVMDFGLARTVEGDSMTQTGALVGTMEYMSPEQAKAMELDARSDLFTVGLICYELLTGQMPYKADSAVASLLKRTQERAAPASSHDSSIPRALSSIVGKCLEPDPKLRYQNAVQVLADLNDWRAKGAAASLHFPDVRTWASDIPWPLIAVVATVLVLAVAGFLLRNKLFGPGSPAVPTAPISVLVADFTNHTGDPVFDGTLEPVINTALEGATFVTAFKRGEARRVAAQLPHPSEKLDEHTATMVAANQGVNVVVSGALERQGTAYELLLKAVRPATGETIANAQSEAPNKDQVLVAATKAAATIRKALGDPTSKSDQLFAMEMLTATSLEAVHEFALGMDALDKGKNQDALQRFSQTTDLDPDFGAAYAGKAISQWNLGLSNDATVSIKEAVKHIDRMTERERYRTRGMFYLLTHNDQKCVDEYTALAARYPFDLGAHANTAICWSNLRNFDKALEQTRIVTQMYPKRLPFQFNISLLDTLVGDFAGAEKQAKAMLQLDPTFPKGYFYLAVAELGEDKLPEAAATYQDLKKLGDIAASIAAGGLGDLAAYQGRYAESAAILQLAAAADLKGGRPERAADKFVALANTQLLDGHKDKARTAAEKALAASQEVKYRFLAAVVFAQTGETGKAHKLAEGLASELGAEPQAYGKLIEGEIALSKGNAREAITDFTDGNKILDTWMGRFDLGRAYLDAGAFTEADAEFDRCIKRRGESLTLFIDEVPTYAYFPIVYYYQGRVREGMKTSNFAASYREYLSIREKAGEDPLIAEIRRRTTPPTGQ